MKIISEVSLGDFGYWGGARATADHIEEECGTKGWILLDAILTDMYPDGIDATELNDLLWFEPDTVYEWLGIGDEEDEDEEEEDDEEEDESDDE